MKQQTKRKQTVPAMLLRAIGIVLLVTVLFALYIWQCMSHFFQTETRKWADIIQQNLLQAAANLDEKNGDLIQQMTNRMVLHTGYEIELYRYGDAVSDSRIQLNPAYTEGCYAVSLLIDEQHHVVADNRRRMVATLKEENGNKLPLLCDLAGSSNPDVRALNATLEAAVKQEQGGIAYKEIRLESIWLNRADNTFIPHKGCLKPMVYQGGVLDASMDYGKDEEFCIELSDPSYELITLSGTGNVEPPKLWGLSISGTTEELVNQYGKVCTMNAPLQELLDQYSGLPECNTAMITLGGKHYELCTLLILNTKDKQILTYYWAVVSVFFCVAMLIAMLLCWRKATLQKAEAAFEHYQRTLLNNLAHDIKSPLTAISCYVENARISLQNEQHEEPLSYLDTIEKNVYYMDDILNRTIELNHLHDATEIRKEEIRMEQLAEEAIGKYQHALAEKDITLRLSGSCKWQAHRGTMVSAVENLVANVAKYTPDHGTITIQVEKNSFTITNSIAAPVDTKQLTMPFVTGDAARSSQSGSGLGLAIVEAAVHLNGMQLQLSADDKTFTAKIMRNAE